MAEKMLKVTQVRSDLGHVARQSGHMPPRQPGKGGRLDLHDVQPVGVRAPHAHTGQLFAQPAHQVAIERAATTHHDFLRIWRVRLHGQRADEHANRHEPPQPHGVHAASMRARSAVV